VTAAPVVLRDKTDSSVVAKLVALLITLFFVATVCVPAAVLNKLLFGLIACLAIVRLVSRPVGTRLRTWSPLVILSVFLYGFLLSLVGNADLDLARQLLFSVPVLLLIYPILWYGVDVDRAIKVAGAALAVLSFVFLAALLASTTSTVAAGLLEVFTRYSLSAAGVRAILVSPIFMFHLGTSPFLVVPFALFAIDLRDRRSAVSAVALLLIGAAIVASTSRGLMLVCLAALALIALERMTNLMRAAFVLVTIPLAAAGVAALMARTNVFSASDVSNAIKIGHAISFVDNLSLAGVFFGEGLASFYYSSGLGQQVAQTEITLLDMLRYFGFLLAPVVVVALLCPSWRLSRYVGDKSRLLSVAFFVLYLLLSLTNPVLFNAAGLSIVVWYWWRVLRDPSEPSVAGPQ
jgi:hypothetical protein